MLLRHGWNVSTSSTSGWLCDHRGVVLSGLLERLRSRFGDRRHATFATADTSLEDLCLALVSSRGEASGVTLASVITDRYRSLELPSRLDLLSWLNGSLAPDPIALASAAQAYLDEPSDAHLIDLSRAAEAPRQEFLRRLNQAPGATSAIVAMRADLLSSGRQRTDLLPLDVDMVHLLTSWFNRGFLEMGSVTWSTPADILERIIAYEAVHEITDWEDLRRRLLPDDRRCFAFFHPVMPDEPLVFVEVALTRGTPRSIADVLSADQEFTDPNDADTAVFYSISNCQPGLSRVSFGNLLLKQVVRDLERELPNVENFVTLSPVPGFAEWVANSAGAEGPITSSPSSTDIRQLALRYFLSARRADGTPLDSVARFHLRNGAALDDLIPDANPSERGRAESLGLMVSYRYDRSRIEDRHEQYIEDHSVTLSEPLISEARSLGLI
jgi:malonyl-CoA decarboxylase